VFHQAHQLTALRLLPSKSCTDTVLAGTYHRFDKRVGLFSRQRFFETPKSDGYNHTFFALTKTFGIPPDFTEVDTFQGIALR
jgi:hypothetical protein